MQAVVYATYGPPHVLQLKEVAKPAPKDNEVLIKVYATTVTAGDWRMRKADPVLARLFNGLLRPKKVTILGFELAGVVETIGKAVTRFQPGDAVFASCGLGFGAYAEYKCLPENGVIAHKPANMTFAEAAAVPIGGGTALRFLRQGKIQPGQNVLIYGASGSVGTYAVQLAKHFGANVTGVCSTTNVAMVQALGADQVIDYTREDFTRSERRYDLILDNAGSRSWRDYKRVLQPKANFVLVGAPKGNPWIGPLSQVIKLRLASLWASQKVTFFVAKLNPADLVVLQELMAAGKVTPCIDRQYALNDLPAAMRYLGAGHAQGKIVVTTV